MHLRQCTFLLVLAILAAGVGERSVVRADALDDAIQKEIGDAIEISKQRFLTSDVHTPWQILHGILALRGEYEVLRDGKPVNAYDYITSNPYYKGEPWFETNEYGGAAHYFTSPYIFEGHRNQFFAIMSMSDLPEDFWFETDDGPITVTDLIANAKARVTDEEEVTWTLWALSHYLTPDASWTNAKGERWSIELMVKIQTRYDVLKSPCGGTHGLFSLARALKRYREVYGTEPRGLWAAAQHKVDRYLKTAQMLQNRDGTFSSDYFKGRGHSRDFNKRIETTGHILEFVVTALPEERLREQWVRNAVRALSRDLIQNAGQSAKCGPLYHAVDALVIYRERVYGIKPANPVQSPKTIDEPAKLATKPDGDAPMGTKSPSPIMPDLSAKLLTRDDSSETETKPDSTPEQPVLTAPKREIDEKRQAELAALAEAEAELLAVETEAEDAEALARSTEERAAEADRNARAARMKATQLLTEADRLARIAGAKRREADRRAKLLAAMREELAGRRREDEDTPQELSSETPQEPKRLDTKNVSDSKPLKSDTKRR